MPVNGGTYEQDIMLVKVFSKSRYPPIRIDDGGEITDGGNRVTVLGWGAESAQSEKKYSDRLRSA